MDRRWKKQGLSLLGVLLFLFISSANFFHTEKTISEDGQCPACNLQKSASFVEFITVFQPDIPEFSYQIYIGNDHRYIFIFKSLTSSRDPPSC
jgi:hypothetical protein